MEPQILILDEPTSNLDPASRRELGETLRSLPITLRHGLAVADLPAHHADPFDRMMIAQAAAEDLVLVTRDPVIERYDIAWLKA